MLLLDCNIPSFCCGNRFLKKNAAWGVSNFPLCGGDDKNLVESFAWGFDLKCLDSIFLLPNAFSSYLNAINLKILKEKFMQSLSAFSLFFWFGPVLSSHDC